MKETMYQQAMEETIHPEVIPETMHSGTMPEKQRKITVRAIVMTGIIAAVYAASTWAIAPLSFGPIQLRFSEILVLLAFLDAAYAPGLILGCIIANFFSPMGMVDVVFGTACTAAALYGITKSPNLLIATFWPAICNAFIGVELHLFLGYPLLFSMATVALGEFTVVTCIGYPVFRKILSNNVWIHHLKIRQ